MFLFAISMCVNTFLNYVLIFGKFGAPALGVTGAAIATFTSRVVEFLVAMGFALFNRRLPLKPRCIFRPGTFIFHSFVKYSTPVVANEAMWSWAPPCSPSSWATWTTVRICCGLCPHRHIDKLSTVVCFGIAASAAVIVGKEIGAGTDYQKVYEISWTLLLVSLMIGGGVALLLLGLLPTFFLPVLFPSSSSPPAPPWPPPLWPSSTPYLCPCGPLTSPTSPVFSGREATPGPPLSSTSRPCGWWPSP